MFVVALIAVACIASAVGGYLLATHIHSVANAAAATDTKVITDVHSAALQSVTTAATTAMHAVSAAATAANNSVLPAAK